MANINDELIEPTALSVTYESYLQVRGLIALQKPLTAPSEHDEMLFIIIHQSYELWFKQILHETDHAIRMLKKGEMMAALRTMQRIVTIQKTLTKQVDILETMTPNDFNRFRANLNPASGFQSFQFRLLEFRLGSKNEAYLKFHKHQPEYLELLSGAMREPTLYDHTLHALAKRGFAIPKEVLERDTSKPYEADERVTKIFAEIYRDCDKHYDIYMLLEGLADLDENFLLWRYRHVAMVSRMIGGQRGTGGSSGVSYLSQTLSKRFFPEVWLCRDLMNTSY